MGCHFLLQWIRVKSESEVAQFSWSSSVAQSCLTLCDPMNRSTSGLPAPSPTPGVYPNPCPLSRWCHPPLLLPSILPSIRVVSSAYLRLLTFLPAMANSSQPQGLQPTRFLRPWDFPEKSTIVGCHYLHHSSSYTFIICGPLHMNII